MAELQMEKSHNRRIFLLDRARMRADKDLEELNKVLLKEIGERWGASREEDSDVNKKPLILYGGWRAVEAAFIEGERRRGHLEEQRIGDNSARWTNWQEKPIEEQWNWLKELRFYPRRRPVLDSADELGGKKEEEDYQIVVEGKRRAI